MRVIEPPPSLLTAVRARYDEPQRVYHNWGHVEALLALYESHKGMLRDPTRVLWAIYWHDAILTRPDMTMRSAARRCCARTRAICCQTRAWCRSKS